MRNGNIQSTLIFLLAGVILASAACKSKESEGVRARIRAPERLGHKAVPKKGGRYYIPKGKLPPRLFCKKDADCGASAFKPGDCCPHHCVGDRPHAGTRAWIAAVNRMRKQACAEFKGSCQKTKCDFFARRCERCIKGRCRKLTGKLCEPRFKTAGRPFLKKR